MELYKRHRPKKLDRVVGNTETVKTLRNMLARGTLPHVLLFHGPSGCGKTTLARILRDELGCHEMDWVELNSSSFRGIDTIREVSRVIHLAPVGKCRIWLLDEVHKLTNDAQNAALKILEDTPSHVYFFLCTTDPKKLIEAIQTRCCKMVVSPLVRTDMETLLKRVVRKEQIDVSGRVFDDIIDASSGSPRTALVLLDKVLNLTDEERTAAIEAHLASESEAIDLCRSLVKKESWSKVSNQLKNLRTNDLESVRWAVIMYARSVLLTGSAQAHQAYIVIDAFSRPFYDTKEAGLAAACYDAIHAEK